MTKEDFIKIFTENPSSDEVMEEINRLYDSETRLTADFNQADADRTQFKKDLDQANKRYRERFLSGRDPEGTDQNGADDSGNTNAFDDLFKKQA